MAFSLETLDFLVVCHNSLKTSKCLIKDVGCARSAAAAHPVCAFVCVCVCRGVQSSKSLWPEEKTPPQSFCSGHR